MLDDSGENVDIISKESDPFGRTRRELVKRYEAFLKGRIETKGQIMQPWMLDNRIARMHDQGITVDTAPRFADEAISRTRKRFAEAFRANGAAAEEAAARADAFAADPERCVAVIWEEEKQRFTEADMAIDKKFKDAMVWLNLLVFLPAVLLFLTSLPITPVFEMAQYYVSHNCQAVGGIKCDGVGPQGQTIPSIFEVLTPPAPIQRAPKEPPTTPFLEPAPASSEQ